MAFPWMKYSNEMIFNIVDGGQRVGQAAFNALHQVRPEWAAEITGTITDPFYEDYRMHTFIPWLMIKIEQEEN